jgi:hypothetical protein
VKIVLRENIPMGIHASVHADMKAAIEKLVDPFATIHKVPEGLTIKGQEKNLLGYLDLQMLNDDCFKVRSALGGGKR